MNILSARLKSARKAKRFTQRELANRTGMDQGHLSRIENQGKGVSMEHLQALARELGVTVSHLIGEDVAEAQINYKGTVRAELLSNYETPVGLRDLAADAALTSALKVTDPEWSALASIELPSEASKNGYVQLLITIRAIAS